MLVDMNHAARLQERFRGLMVGLALGDSVDFLYDEPITPGPATELAVYQLHSQIKAWRGPSDRGPVELFNVTGRGLIEWAWVREGNELREGIDWPWFAQLPAFKQPHGNPSGTLNALKNGLNSTGGATSRGSHGMLRTAPLALLGVHPTADAMTDAAYAIARMTHDDKIGAEPAVLFVSILAALMSRPEGAPLAETIVEAFGSAPVTSADERFTIGAEGHADLATLNQIAPNGRANRVLPGAIYVATCFPQDIEAAILFASQGRDGDALTATVGAILGAANGVTPWMAQRFSSHEFAWPIEALVQDAFIAALCGDERPTWLQWRYPTS